MNTSWVFAAIAPSLKKAFDARCDLTIDPAFPCFQVVEIFCLPPFIL